MPHYKAPQIVPPKNGKRAIFLAGSIDKKNKDWREEVIDTFNSKFIICDPRRNDWNSTWKIAYSNPEFYQQNKWELETMEKADLIIFNFLAESQSPVSMLELGLYAKSKKSVVCCPDNFYKAGNIHMVCQHYDIPLFKTMEELINYLIMYY